MRAADRIATDLEAVDETIVNVTIGRIELKAVTQPEQAAAPRPFPSLQEYLRRAGDGGT